MPKKTPKHTPCKSKDMVILDSHQWVAFVSNCVLTVFFLLLAPTTAINCYLENHYFQIEPILISKLFFFSWMCFQLGLSELIYFSGYYLGIKTNIREKEKCATGVRWSMKLLHLLTNFGLIILC